MHTCLPALTFWVCGCLLLPCHTARFQLLHNHQAKYKDQNKYVLRLVFFNFSTQQVSKHPSIFSQWVPFQFRGTDYRNFFELSREGRCRFRLHFLVAPWLSPSEVSPGKKTADEPHSVSLSPVACTHTAVLVHSHRAFAPELDFRTPVKTLPMCSTGC